MLENVAYHGEIFDESFGSYLDDVDLAWRAQLLGWRCEYAPAATARHRRSLAPGRCEIRQSPVDRYTGRNRWRLLLKNELSPGWRRQWRRLAVGRDASGGEMIMREQSSLRSLAAVAGGSPGLWRRRNDVMRRRVASDADMLRWFEESPEPASPKPSRPRPSPSTPERGR